MAAYIRVNGKLITVHRDGCTSDQSPRTAGLLTELMQDRIIDIPSGWEPDGERTLAIRLVEWLRAADPDGTAEFVSADPLPPDDGQFRVY